MDSYISNNVRIQFERLGRLSYADLYNLVYRYTLDAEQLVACGYPLRSHFPGCAMIINSKPALHPSSNPIPNVSISRQRTCSRCRKLFVDNQEGNTAEEEHPKCLYHREKVVRYVWQCCGQSVHSAVEGCTIASAHVWSGLLPGLNGPLHGFRETMRCPNIMFDGNYGIYAVDCEMIFNKRGLELARVSVVNVDGCVVYDTFVKPEAEVLDYNTRFSDVTAEDIEGTSKTLGDVQQDLLSFIYAESILVRHGLENDLRALKIIHGLVVDTSVVYPHRLGLPMRSSLKILTSTILNKNIQDGAHDSAEHARTVMDLILLKIAQNL